MVDEPEATVQIFSVIEGMQELRPQAVVDLCRSREGGQFLSFLSECLRAKGDLRPDAAELLSILLLDPAITDAFCSDGERVDTLLIAMSQFRKRNPKDTGEDECMANIFDCAACAVLAGKGKKAFLSVKRDDDPHAARPTCFIHSGASGAQQRVHESGR